MNINLSDKNVLVTGGAGFIGSNLCEALLDKKNKVICLDNFSTGKRENIKPFLNHPNFTLLEGDIRNIEDCREATKGVDFVLHQAALGSVPAFLRWSRAGETAQIRLGYRGRQRKPADIDCSQNAGRWRQIRCHCARPDRQRKDQT